MAFTPPTFGTAPTVRRPQVQFPVTPQAPTPSGRGTLANIGNFLNTPAGQAGIGALGGLLAARDQNAQSDKQLAAEQGMSAQRLQADLLTQQQNDARQRQAAVLDASPLGANQNFAAQQALLSGIAGMAGSGGFRPSDPAVAAAMPTGGNLTLPPEVVAALQQAHGQQATAASIAQRQMDLTRMDPGRGDAGTLDTLGLGDTSGLAEHLATFQKAQQDEAAASAQKREALMRALDNNPTQSTQPEAQKSTPWWKKALKVASIAAPIVAAPFTGGTSLALIGAGAGAASSALNGGGLKGAILGGTLGAATGGLGGAANGTKQAFSAGALARAAVNPKTLTTVGSQVVPGMAGQALGLASQFAPGMKRG